VTAAGRGDEVRYSRSPASIMEEEGAGEAMREVAEAGAGGQGEEVR
jgi:hypothetical protein